MLRNFTALLFCFLSLFFVDGSAATLTSDVNRLSLGGSDVAYLRDTSGLLDIQEVSSANYASAFRPAENGFRFGYTKDVIWFKISLRRDAAAPADWSLEITNSFINDLRLYTPAGDTFNVAQAGDRFPFAERKISFHNPVFALSLADPTPRDFYLRIESDSSLAAQLLIWKPTHLRDNSQIEVLFLGGVIGMVLMSFLISTIHWLFRREPLILRFSVLTAAVLVFVPAQLGLWSQFIFPYSPNIADAMVPWTLAATIATIQIVFSRTLEIPKHHPKFNRFLAFLTAITLLLPITRELDLYSQIGGPGLQFSFMVGLLCTAWVSFSRWQLRVSGSGYFAIAHVAFIISLLLGRLELLGFFSANALTQSSWLPGLVAFLILVHIGIVVSAREDSRGRIEARTHAQAAQAVANHEQQMRQDQALFFAFVAHELRSPLAVIVIGLQNLHRELADATENIHSRLKRIDRAAHRMGDLVERHLTLQRLAIANFEPALTEIDPQKPALEAIANAQEEHPRHTFDLVVEPNLPTTAHLDGILVQLALGNLLSNAAKYSPQGTSVKLEIVQTDGMLHFRVTDHGTGVPPLEQARLFDIFKRTSHAQSKAGFGIGLATVRRVAEVQGGIATYADGIDGGAVFTLSLPADNRIDLGST